MLTKVDLCSMALLKLGERPIQSLSDDSVASQLARTLFNPVMDALVASHPWRFATRTYELTETVDNDFVIPSDVLRVIRTHNCPEYKNRNNCVGACCPRIISCIFRIIGGDKIGDGILCADDG